MLAAEQVELDIGSIHARHLKTSTAELHRDAMKGVRSSEVAHNGDDPVFVMQAFDGKKPIFSREITALNTVGIPLLEQVAIGRMIRPGTSVKAGEFDVRPAVDECLSDVVDGLEILGTETQVPGPDQLAGLGCLQRGECLLPGSLVN